MKRPLRPDELRVWAEVARTVVLAPGRSAPEPPEEPAPPPPAPQAAAGAARTGSAPRRPCGPAEEIEPKRKRRLARARDPIEARLDLHGLDYDRARGALHAFLQRAHADGLRAVLVITGKGREGDGVLKRFAPEWLADPAVRPMIAGVSMAERRHGGEGALYVALKRRA
ncbi:MAG: Smr/MutS family protein [Pseudomonadota bacterium]|nr:Smr/MutS family protein [Pseudomonadota bacterium]